MAELLSSVVTYIGNTETDAVCVLEQVSKVIW